ncbi:MAG: hypothetical protein EOO77_11825 [Oxalobacteraceae bacterium]|nr:MAG: hypothetical protein EOO77_11825 [Oxalobacteraceae bacterium]
MLTRESNRRTTSRAFESQFLATRLVDRNKYRRSVAATKAYHDAEMNGRPELGSGEGATTDRLWVAALEVVARPTSGTNGNKHLGSLQEGSLCAMVEMSAGPFWRCCTFA